MITNSHKPNNIPPMDLNGLKPSNCANFVVWRMQRLKTAEREAIKERALLMRPRGAKIITH